MSARGLAIDAAAWSGPWRARRVRDKAVLSFGLLLCALLLPPWPAGVATALVAAVALIGPARVHAGLLARSLRIPLTFVLLGAATIAVSIGGGSAGSAETLWQAGFLSVTTESLAMAGTAVVRGTAGTLSVFVLAATTPMVDLLAAMRRLRIPDPLIDIAGLTYRLVFVLLQSANAITAAQTARLGYASRRAALRSAAGVTSAVLLRTWQRSSRLEAGLAGRGFTDAIVTVDPPRIGSARFVGVSLAAVSALAVLAVATGWGR